MAKLCNRAKRDLKNRGAWEILTRDGSFKITRLIGQLPVGRFSEPDVEDAVRVLQTIAGATGAVAGMEFKISESEDDYCKSLAGNLDASARSTT